MSTIFKRGRAELEANLTPMIDVTFLLIVFFVLVSQIVEVESVDMRLPEPESAPTVKPVDEHRVVINVVPAEQPVGGASSYRVGGRTFPANDAGLLAMTEHLAAMYRSNPALNINLRADQATHYQWVEQAMQSVVGAAVLSGRPEIVPRINLVVVQDPP